MNVLLIDPMGDSRREMELALREAGFVVKSFRDGTLAYLFLLSRFESIGAVAINIDDAGPFLQRLDSLSGLGVAFAMVTYSGRDRSRRAEISARLLPVESSRTSPRPIATTHAAGTSRTRKQEGTTGCSSRVAEIAE